MIVGSIHVRHRGRLFDVFLDDGYPESATVIKGKPLEIGGNDHYNPDSDTRRFWKLFYRLKKEEIKREKDACQEFARRRVADTNMIGGGDNRLGNRSET